MTFTYLTARSNLVPCAFVWGKKVKQWIFQKLLISKLVDAVNQLSTWTYMNIKGQGNSVTLFQGHSDLTFANFFSLETAKLIEA